MLQPEKNKKNPEKDAIREYLESNRDLYDKLMGYPAISEFIDRLKKGDKYAILDVDGTLFKNDSWGESLEIPGLFRDPERYQRDRILFRKKEIDLNEVRRRKYSNMHTTVSEQLAQTLDCPEIQSGMQIEDNVLFHLGRWKGRDIIKDGSFYSSAFDAIGAIESVGNKLLFISASPRQFIGGVLSELLEEMNIQARYDVLGAELISSDDGQLHRRISMSGNIKETMALIMKSKGVDLTFGAGDSPHRIDLFLPHVETPLIIDRSDGNSSWEPVAEQFRQKILDAGKGNSPS